MWKKKFLFLLLLQLIFILSYESAKAKEYVIYSISQDVPMGYKGEKLRKNFHLTMGSDQGVQEGTLLDVFRMVSVFNPYKANGQYSNYKLKVGELSVIQTDKEFSTANLHKFNKEEKAPILEIEGFMIGDQVEVHTE
ncbi:MAG: hypothetical protein HQK52_01290 [Oligoflexia bacterium]|nr:hypothetical protein [Oligoflexia bacterium]